MSTLNKVMLIGRLGKDPDLRSTTTGLAVATFSVATNQYKGKGDTREEVAEWHNIVCYGKQAEWAGESLKKGSQCYVEGRLQTRKWKDKAGVDRWTTEVIADIVNGLSDTGKRERAGSDTPKPASQDYGPTKPFDHTEQDDLPF